MATDNAPAKGLEKEVRNPTDAGDKNAVSITSVDDASIKSFGEKAAMDNAAAARSVEKDFGTLAFDYGSGTESPDAKVGDDTPADGAKDRTEQGETPADGDKEAPVQGDVPQAVGDKPPNATEGEQTPQEAGGAVGENMAEAAYDWHIGTHARFSLGEDRARQAWDLRGTLEIPNTEEGLADAIYWADEDVKSTGDKFAHALTPEIAQTLLKEIDEDTHNVSGDWADEEAGIAYLKIDNFMGSDTAEDLANLMDSKFKGARGIILDLRSNPGGQVDEGLEAAALFLESGRLMSNLERVPNLTSAEFEYKERSNSFELTASSIEKPALSNDDSPADGKIVEPRGAFADRTDGTPLTILVDENTMSSSEILLAALRQNAEANARIVGEQTGGKGIGQTVLVNPETGSASTVTSMKFFRPDGTWAGDVHDHKNGMLPDMNITSDITDRGPEDVQYRFALADMRNRIGQ
ncbi:hypothetical protein GC174_10190 [bacterium]|nr:hypothetical protein [bacterium]